MFMLGIGHQPASRWAARVFIGVTKSGAALLVSALIPVCANAETDTLPPLTMFTASGGVLDVTMTMARAIQPTILGKDLTNHDIPVDALTTLTVCDASSPAVCANPYAGAALKLTPGDTLKVRLVNQLGGSSGSVAGLCMDATQPFDFVNGWSSVGGLLNKHFHGLLTPPTEGKPGDVTRPFGDFIFTCTSGFGPSAERRYSITLPADHPAGIDWFHPHIHGIAKPQVASGMAGMILIGDPQCSDPAACATIRPILLKDAQLVQVPGAGGAPHWVNFADQEPDFCGENKMLAGNVGGCTLPPGTELTSGGTTLTPSEGHWVFTLNGAQYPTVVAGEAQVWRVQNASANITYRLSLRRLNADAGQVVADAPFEVISLDGAGLAGTPDTGQYAPLAREVLLMPGSRADLRVSRPASGGDGDLTYQLVNEAFQAGFAPDDADTWPHVALAKVIFPAPQVVATTMLPASPLRARTAIRSLSARTRVPVQASGAALLRGTPLMRGINQIPERLGAMAPLPPESGAPETMPAAPQTPDAATAGPTSPPHAMSGHAMPSPVTPSPVMGGAADQNRLDRLFAMGRWLREDCDGYLAGDAASQVDAQLAQAVPGHQAITNNAERKVRYWTALHFDLRTTHRRIYFGIQDADGDERFVLGETFVVARAHPSGPPLVELDLYGRPISPTNPVVLTTFNAEKGLCVLKRNRSPTNPSASVEQWELVNISKEVHNFHIHQMKFTVARDANGQAIMRTPSAADLVQLPASLLLASDSGAGAELQHDTIIVPRGISQCGSNVAPLGAVGTGGGHPVYAFMLNRSDPNSACAGLDRGQLIPSAPHDTSTDGSGMILVNLSFDGNWLAAERDGAGKLEPARFVFHCHILEHEDKGMMHRVAVLEPYAP